MPPINKKEVTDYFRQNLFESIGAYTGWKILMASKLKGIVSKEMTNRYVEIQNYHNYFSKQQNKHF